MNNLSPTVKTVLLGAAETMRRRGRTVGAMCQPDGRVCVIGSIQVYVDELGISDPVIRGNLVADASEVLFQTISDDPEVQSRGPTWRPHPTAWNDKQCTSDAQALEMLERAANRA